MAVTVIGTTSATYGIATEELQAGINAAEIRTEVAPSFRTELQGPTGEVKALAIGAPRYTATVSGELTGTHGFTVTGAATIALAAGTFNSTSGTGYYLTDGTITWSRDGFQTISATLESISTVVAGV